MAIRKAMDIYPPDVYQGVLTDFIREGHFARHVRRMRLLYAERRTSLVEAIRSEFGHSVETLGAEAGMHLVATLPKGVADRPLAQRAAQNDLLQWPLSPCYLKAPARLGLILGFGSTTPRQMRIAVRRLRELISLQ